MKIPGNRLLAASAFLVAFLVANHADAALTLTSGSNATTTPSVATSITGFQIVGDAASTTPVQLRATYGTLSMTTTTGLTFDGSSSGSTINFSGTVANINNALSTLKYTRGSTGSDTLEVSLVNKGEVFFPDNGHLYKFIAGSYSWSAASTSAGAQTAYGTTGYLATITSSEENTFVYNRITGDGWLGTTDTETEKTWKWVTGPEAGTSYFQENPSGGGGSAISGRYNGWASGEPNDYGTGEDCGYMYSTQGGEWNDFPCSALQGYVAEFGRDGALPTVVATQISIVTADVPAITTLSPANGSTTVSTTANLVIGFSKTVTKQTGNIVIKKVLDDTTFESIDVSGSLVTGSGSASITVNPSGAMAEGTQYYVTIPGTAFKDASNNFFDGISASTTWRFTTGDFTAPVISDLEASSTASTTASVLWNTNESASTKVVYGPTASYGLTTSETATSTGVTSHPVSLTGLLSCTTYHYAAVSRDASLNAATSSDATFTTSGCAGAATPSTATSTAITSTSGGSTSVSDSGKTFTVIAPANATATSSSFVIQVQAIPSADVLASIGRPGASPNEVGVTVFEVKAIIDGTTILDSFDEPVTIEYEYSDSEIEGLDESTISLYHYHDDDWDALDGCSVDTAANTITCTTPNFSIFGLFGEEAEEEGSSRTTAVQTRFGCKDPNALNYDRFVKHKADLCTYGTLALATPVTPAAASTDGLCPAYAFTRRLEIKSVGEDVRALQKFLNCAGFKLAASGPGAPGEETDLFAERTKAALIRFQESYASEILAPIGATKGTAIFGEYSKAKAYTFMKR